MLFWIGIMFGAMFAWWSIKIGFYQTWATFFNIVISIFLAFSLHSTIITNCPAAGEKWYGDMLTLLVMAVGSFIVLQGFSVLFITGNFNVSIPKMIDFCCSAFLGFICGLLVWNCALFAVSITPLTKMDFVKNIGFDQKTQENNLSYMSSCCSVVNEFVSTDDMSLKERMMKITNKIESRKPKNVEFLPDANLPKRNKTDPNLE